jgi:hypothetical protein
MVTRTAGPRVEPPFVVIALDDLAGPFDFDNRIQRCYELAANAMVSGKAPEGSFLLHGSWHGPGARRRIGHASVALPEGLIWEPIQARVYHFEDWEYWTQWRTEATYTKTDTSRNMLTSGHYGRWHESRYP